MFTNIVKSVAIAALLLALLWRPSGTFELVLQWVICISAVMVMLQAGFAGKFWLTAAFLAMAVLFNPVVPVGLSESTTHWLNSACVMMFALSWIALSTAKPKLAIAATRNRTRESESF